jgi:hypothetical protein
VIAVAARTEIVDSRSLARVTVSIPEHAVGSLRPGAFLTLIIDSITLDWFLICHAALFSTAFWSDVPMGLSNFRVLSSYQCCVLAGAAIILGLF